jgi:hypothetical protein
MRFVEDYDEYILSLRPVIKQPIRQMIPMQQAPCHPLMLPLTVCLASWIVFAPTVSGGEDPAPGSQTVVSLPYGWPFLSAKQMQHRGGTTEGFDVTLEATASAPWKALQDASLSPVEKDRRAILALAGSYRVSFQFIETMGVVADYHPPQPYFSWGTEFVHVLRQSERNVSLQHTLVMYFREEDGSMSPPMVMKHWRQEWNYQDRDLHTYRGNQVWARWTLTDQEVRGRWTQAVYQVDDSPRYETIGRWDHTGGVSRWTSEDAWRPLPRREFSVRDDYNVLASTHTITVTPTGWVHTQDNRKLLVAEGQDQIRCLACEAGINRYERIIAPDLASPADAYWAKTGDYWREVRAMWAEVCQARDRFRLQKQVGDAKLYQEHFEYADRVQENERYDAASGREHARETIGKFLVDAAVTE